MERALTNTIQDYLKSIYQLTAGGEAASTNALAQRLGISPASVTGMVQRLAATKPPLVAYRKHQGARLTRAGRLAALHVIRHHRLLETWLVAALGYSWEDVHQEAEQLEHFISEDFEKRIAAALGNPSRDPHGEPIPSDRLVMPPDRSISLLKLRTGQRAVVRRVQADDPAALRQLNRSGVAIGTRLRLKAISTYDKVLSLQIRGQKQLVPVGPAMAGRIYVDVPRPVDRRNSRSAT